MAYREGKKKTDPWEVKIPARAASDLWWAAKRRGLTFPQLFILLGSALTREIIDIDAIESALRKEGWWDPERFRSRGDTT